MKQVNVLDNPTKEDMGQWYSDRNLEPMFNVYKEGSTTDGPITILKKEGLPFNEKAKRDRYSMLGFTITEIS